MTLECLESRRVEGNRAPAAAGPGLAHLPDAVDRHPGAADGEMPHLHVEVLPAKTERLAAAHAGHGQETPEGEETIVSDTGKEGGELFGAPDR